MIHFSTCMGRFLLLFSSLNVWLPSVFIGPVAFIVPWTCWLLCSGPLGGISVSCGSRGPHSRGEAASGLHLCPRLLPPVVFPTLVILLTLWALPGSLLLLLSGRTQVASLSQLLCGKATFCHSRWEELKP